MKLAIVGSRTFDDYDFMKNMLQYHSFTKIISGGAKGADTLARRYSAEKGISIIEFIPDWETFGKSAGYLRNEKIISTCDELVAFWDKKSKGTGHSVRLAEKAGKPIYIYWPPEKEIDITEGIGI
jgi:predicted Rossmann fold nucleotide-binding protein DprA/Smf involved in DNA uptake